MGGWFILVNAFVPRICKQIDTWMYSYGLVRELDSFYHARTIDDSLSLQPLSKFIFSTSSATGNLWWNALFYWGGILVYLDLHITFHLTSPYVGCSIVHGIQTCNQNKNILISTYSLTFITSYFHSHSSSKGLKLQNLSFSTTRQLQV